MAKKVPQRTDETGGFFCYAIKKPSARRKTFKIERVALPAGRPRTTLSFPEVDSVNALFLSGTISFEDALKKLQTFRDDLYRARDAARPKVVFHSQNAKVLEEYWETEYSDRDLVDVGSARTRLLRHVAGCGERSLAVASKQDLQRAIDAHFPSPARQREAVDTINSLLRFLGRGFKLKKKKKVFAPVKYLSLVDFERVLPHLQDPAFAALAKAAFVTGCRVGELFPLTDTDNRGAFVLVETQLDENEQERETKNRKRRKAFVLKERREWLTEWLAIPDRGAQRNRKHADIFMRACEKAFPGRPEKHLRFHDIRHSYAVYLLQVKGATLQLVANSLGNGAKVCEDYYAGFVLTDPGIDYLERL